MLLDSIASNVVAVATVDVAVEGHDEVVVVAAAAVLLVGTVAEVAVVFVA